MSRPGMVVALSIALAGCTDKPQEQPQQQEPPAVIEDFSDEGAGALQRVSFSLQDSAVSSRLSSCLSQVKGEGLVSTDLKYRKSGETWMLDSVQLRGTTLPKGQDAIVHNCIEGSVRGTSFTVDSNEEVEAAAQQLVLRMGMAIPLPPRGTEVSNDAIARMIGTSGGVVTMEGCSTCRLKKDGTGNYECVQKKSGKESDCEIISTNACATTPKACVSGFFGGSRGVVMF